MTAAQILERLRSRGVELRYDGERIRFQPAKLGDDVLAMMREHRDGIAALLDAERRRSDALLLDMLHRRDAAVRATAGRAASNRHQCHACGHENWWHSVHHDEPVCAVCHPPASGAEREPRRNAACNEPSHAARTTTVASQQKPSAPIPSAWACPRGHCSEPSAWRRWGCGACRIEFEGPGIDQPGGGSDDQA